MDSIVEAVLILQYALKLCCMKCILVLNSKIDFQRVLPPVNTTRQLNAYELTVVKNAHNAYKYAGVHGSIVGK